MFMRPKSEWDPENMLNWLIKELDDAERLGEKVWILGVYFKRILMLFCNLYEFTKYNMYLHYLAHDSCKWRCIPIF